MPATSAGMTEIVLNLDHETSRPGRLLKRELAARSLSANRLSLDIGVPSGRITDILNGRRAISADAAVRRARGRAGGGGGTVGEGEGPRLFDPD